MILLFKVTPSTHVPDPSRISRLRKTIGLPHHADFAGQLRHRKFVRRVIASAAQTADRLREALLTKSNPLEDGPAFAK
jgi:hypothetical protein